MSSQTVSTNQQSGAPLAYLGAPTALVPDLIARLLGRPAIRPVQWSPPGTPDRARSTTSEIPLPDLRVFDVGGEGPEDVLVDHRDGSVLTGVADGRVLRLRPEDGSVQTIADTAGRPLGLEWLPDGRLLVCDARRGLLAVEPSSGSIEELATEAGGRRIRLCNNAAVAQDGSIWFSDSTGRFDLDHWKADLLEHGGTGRLLRRDPDGSVDVLAEGLNFANGVALTADLAQVLVAETGSYTVLARPSQPGEMPLAPLQTNLPGFPDNMSTGTDGLVWLALASPRNPVVDRLAPLPGLVRQIVWALPEVVQPEPEHQTWVLALDPKNGRVVHDLQGSHPDFGKVTGVREHQGTVWLGSLYGTWVASFTVPEAAPVD